jgi:hypothetical protein
VPARFRHDKQLVSHDTHTSSYNYKYTFSVEIAPVCKVGMGSGKKKSFWGVPRPPQCARFGGREAGGAWVNLSGVTPASAWRSRPCARWGIRKSFWVSGWEVSGCGAGYEAGLGE